VEGLQARLTEVLVTPVTFRWLGLDGGVVSVELLVVMVAGALAPERLPAASTAFTVKL
jgi:hypothetical protein